jgi:tRNA-dihydrouridine synthase B
MIKGNRMGEKVRIGNIETKSNVFLAPMAGITDKVFRIICRQYGCGLAYTEMVSAKGLFYESERTWELLDIEGEEHPIGAQIFGSDPKIMAKMVAKIGDTPIDIIDINMGCPAPKIVKNGEGSALIKDPQLAGQIVDAVVTASKKPVTVKIRKGWDDNNINAVEVARAIEEAGAAAITVHGRTRQQFYSGQADWDIIKKVKEAVDIPVIGNGDIADPESAKAMLEETNCDAIMIGRGSQGNPWIFSSIIYYLETGEFLTAPSPKERIDMAIYHVNMVVDYKGEHVGLPQMRKHIAWYLKGLKDANKVKTAINSASSIKEVEYILSKYLNYLGG